MVTVINLDLPENQAPVPVTRRLRDATYLPTSKEISSGLITIPTRNDTAHKRGITYPPIEAHPITPNLSNSSTTSGTD